MTTSEHTEQFSYIPKITGTYAPEWEHSMEPIFASITRAIEELDRCLYQVKDLRRQTEDIARQFRQEAEPAPEVQEETHTGEADKTERAESRTIRTTDETLYNELYEGEVILSVLSTADFRQVRKFQEYLGQIQDLEILLVGGSENKGIEILVSAAKPLRLMYLLDRISLVEKVIKNQNRIQVALKSE